jgi:hypothetical protein
MNNNRHTMGVFLIFPIVVVLILKFYGIFSNSIFYKSCTCSILIL